MTNSLLSIKKSPLTLTFTDGSTTTVNLSKLIFKMGNDSVLFLDQDIYSNSIWNNKMIVKKNLQNKRLKKFNFNEFINLK